MAQKIYAVKKGRETGIFNSWPECQAQVTGFNGALYKGFKTKQEADDYLAGIESDAPAKKKKTSTVKKDVMSVAQELELTDKYSSMDNCIVVYTDGSNILENLKVRYSYGFVVIKNNEIIFEGNGEGTNEEASKLENVAGELTAAMQAVLFAKKQFPNQKLYIFHDYQGVSSWALGDWKAKNPTVKKYVEFMKKYESIVPFDFVKVTGHKGNPFNVRADRLAALALK